MKAKSQKLKTKISAKIKKQPIKLKAESSKDISALILRDHEPIKKLISILKDSKVGIAKKRPAYIEFEKKLSVHAKAEEESLYVQMKKEDNLRIEGLEGDIEHVLAVQLMKEIDLLKNDDLWMAKVKVLAELVDHHVKEEEKEVLTLIRKELDSEERIKIGTEYTTKLGELQAESKGKMNFKDLIDNANGKVGVPILLYFLGFPGIFVIIIWLFFFRGK